MFLRQPENCKRGTTLVSVLAIAVAFSRAHRFNKQIVAPTPKKMSGTEPPRASRFAQLVSMGVMGPREKNTLVRKEPRISFRWNPYLLNLAWNICLQVLVENEWHKLEKVVNTPYTREMHV